MRSLVGHWPSTPDFHPEFGLLCSSPRRRRSMRLAMASAAAGDAGGRVSRHRVGRAICAVGGGIRIEQRDAARSAGRRRHEHRVGREQG